MMEQCASFGGLDTCNHDKFGNFEKHSILRFENEDRAIAHWYGVNTHLDTLSKHKIISSETANSMRAKAKIFKQTTIVEKYLKGSTYIPFKAAIAFQENIRSRILSVTILDHNNKNGIVINYKRYIPLFIYPCQNLTKHGVQVVVIPRFRGSSENKIL
jgi:hypothetical protein